METNHFDDIWTKDNSNSILRRFVTIFLKIRRSIKNRFSLNVQAVPHSTVGSVRTWEQGFAGSIPGRGPIFFPTIDYSHCDRIHSSLTAVLCFDNGYVGKHPMAWKEYCAEYCFKELQESMVRCTGCRDITEILLKTPLNTVQSILNVQCWSIAKQFVTGELLEGHCGHP